MIISVNWLKKFTDIDLPIDELATLIGARLVEIESIVDLGAKYKDVLIVKVVECAPLEGTDHLNLTKIDDGGTAKDVERDERGLVQVVCGAPNVKSGMLAAWLPVGSIVPNTFDSAEPFTLTAKDLRGVISNGMLASAKELDLGDGHDGIVEITVDAKPGDNFASAYELDDYLLDIENKSLTHRPDTFGVIGFAREVAAITGKAFHSPEWLHRGDPIIKIEGASAEVPGVVIDDESLSERYEGVVLSRSDNAVTNELTIMATLLARSGVRPISPIVDVTNYLMLLSGQPLHAFDYDKLITIAGENPVIHVRAARDGETLALLDGRTVSLSSEDIVIAAGETPVALAGAMGGMDTEVDDSTTRIFLESATFNLYSLRSTQMRHGIFSEAITRFTKGQPGDLTAPALGEAVRLLQEIGLQPISQIVQAYPGQRTVSPIDVSVGEVNALLGSELTATAILEVLKNVEFSVEANGDQLSVTAPFWRADIHIPEDIVEEVGRISGYDSITPTLPERDLMAVAPSQFDQLRARLRSLLVRAGANEALTYSFVHGDVLTKAGQKTEDSYLITNSISPDLQYYRQSLTPSLLQVVHPNIKNGFESFALFELNKVHPKQRGQTAEHVPDEANALALTIAYAKQQPGAPYYQAKKILDFVLTSVGLQLEYTTLDQEINYPTASPFEYRRSAMVTDIVSGERLGMAGEYTKRVSKNFKLPEYVAGFELDMDAISRAVDQVGKTYQPLSRYPSTERDVCFQVESSVTYARIVSSAYDGLKKSGLDVNITPVDIYQPQNGVTKNVTIRIRLTAHDRTLTNEEITTTVSSAINSVTSATEATVI